MREVSEGEGGEEERGPPLPTMGKARVGTSETERVRPEDDEEDGEEEEEECQSRLGIGGYSILNGPKASSVVFSWGNNP